MKYIAWNTEYVTRHNEFETKAEAETWCNDMNDKYAKAKRLESSDRFTFGTEKAYEKARQKWMEDAEARARAEQESIRQGFYTKLDNHIRRVKAECEALEKLVPVCQKFDGKVINKRFKDAADAVLGQSWYITLGQAYGPWLEVNCYGNEYEYGQRPCVAIYKSDKNYQGQLTRQGWDWITGSRLEAEKAIQVLRNKREDLVKYIDTLEAQRGQYDEYLEKRCKAAAMIRELNAYGADLQNYCKDNIHMGVYTGSIF